MEMDCEVEGNLPHYGLIDVEKLFRNYMNDSRSIELIGKLKAELNGDGNAIALTVYESVLYRFVTKNIKSFA